MTDQEPLSLSEKRSAAAKARWDNQAHPLFLYEPGERAAEPIAFINIRRYGANGPVDHQRVWPAVELQTQDDIYAFFGGGVYELIGRRALPNGTPGNIVRKQRLTLDGPQKPFVGTAQADGMAGGQVQAASGGQGQGYQFATLMAMMADERRERRIADERRQEREELRAGQHMQLMVTALGSVTSLVAAIINRPAPPPPQMPDIAGTFQAGMQAMAAVLPKHDTTDPIERVAKILEVAKQIKPDEKGESVGDFMNGLGQAMTGFAQVEGMRIEAARAGLTAQPMPQGQETPPPPHANGHPPPTSQAPPVELDPHEVAGLAS
jgi:hypothetical protein